ncbi:MAG TPA: cupin domain-containing protein [Humisphaera sp.]|jgi:quercetin dioxygenase-like cupin family protein|nr:cupin domain-containing protein [Humisphaera sp.]
MMPRLFRVLLAACALYLMIAAGCTSLEPQPAPSAAESAATGGAPQDSPTTKPATVPGPLASGGFNWNELAIRSVAFGQQRPVFRSPTATLDELEVHITTLNPGQEPHPPHRHAYEEMMLLKEGSLEATVNGRTFTLAAGSVLFLAPNDLHGWHNNGSTPATYFVLSWKTPKTGAAK